MFHYHKPGWQVGKGTRCRAREWCAKARGWCWCHKHEQCSGCANELGGRWESDWGGGCASNWHGGCMVGLGRWVCSGCASDWASQGARELGGQWAREWGSRWPRVSSKSEMCGEVLQHTERHVVDVTH